MRRVARFLRTWRAHSGHGVVLACVLICMALPARADVWAFVDEKGVPHFASERVDDRYELFFRQTDSFDTSLDAAPEPAHGPMLPLGNPGKLLNFFEVSPTFKLVRQHLREASSDLHIDFELLQALIATESGFNSGAVSPKGAIGLMQIMPATARRYGIESDKKLAIEVKLVDPRINIKTGTRYLRDLINMFPGQIELALAAYNAGEGAVQRAGNQIPNYKETQNYVKTVMQIYQMLKPQNAAPELRHPLSRVRPAIQGGALNRGNLPAGGAISPAKTNPSTGPDPQ